MPTIHFVERLQNVHRVDKDKNEWESGYWVVSEDTAQRLVGGYIYLHRGQDEPSHFGGKILSFHVHPNGLEAGRIVFRFHAGLEFKGVKAGRDGWGNEKKIVW
ncbi:MAG: hypothetical protein ACYC02_03880 [Thiobacillus sp.]